MKTNVIVTDTRERATLAKTLWYAHCRYTRRAFESDARNRYWLDAGRWTKHGARLHAIFAASYHSRDRARET